MDDFAERLVEEIPHLRRYARSLTCDAEHGDDLVQDCLHRAWSRMHLWQQDGNTRAWLFTIMHNIFVNDIRKAQRLAPTEPLELRQHATVGQSDGDRAMLMRDLEQALAQLRADHREVLILVGVEQMSYQEVADLLDIPLGTVMSRLHRARSKMRDWMNGEQPRVTLRPVT